MAEAEKSRTDLGELISFLRWLRGWSRPKLGKKTGIDKSQLGRYEAGEETPRRASFQKITEATGVPPRVQDFIRWCLRLVRKAVKAGERARVPASKPESREETRVAVWAAVDRALSLARAELALLRSAPPPGRLSPPTEEDHRRVEVLWERLKGTSEAKRRLLIEGAQAYKDWLLCVRICAESETVAANTPGEALELAELALFVARHVPGTDAWRSRLQGWCTGLLANAQRAGDKLRPAETTFARVWRLWRAGKDEAGLLSEAYLLDLEASLRRDQRQFPRALKLHADALKLARPEERGFILLNKGFTLQEKGDYELALSTLEQAAEAIDGERQPRLRCVLRFNQAATLIRLGRAAEAAPIVPEVRELAERLGNAIDLIKTTWLEGNLLAALGRRQEATEALEKTRRDLEAEELPYNYALASLDLALVYREQGRFAEIAALAAEILKIFEAQGVQREAIAAVILLREAAEKEQVTADLVQRLADFLKRAHREPGLRFEA